MGLTNPPFGRKSSMTYVSDEGEVGREDLEAVLAEFSAVAESLGTRPRSG